MLLLLGNAFVRLKNGINDTDKWIEFGTFNGLGTTIPRRKGKLQYFINRPTVNSKYARRFIGGLLLRRSQLAL